ncbi:hypothetical protein SLEP1_g24319 [Rubroshorea leprosula]|uniref:Uncharacterized protein n=1 Tax=Rubroshorea leprosula TaxID=152421 RepID=A0AAV5JPI6_9ROSI|nr:hypothetical protein SLEP1_g24319 [Rubroshorea leprosula]
MDKGRPRNSSLTISKSASLLSILISLPLILLNSLYVNLFVSVSISVVPCFFFLKDKYSIPTFFLKNSRRGERTRNGSFVQFQPWICTHSQRNVGNGGKHYGREQKKVQRRIQCNHREEPISLARLVMEKSPHSYLAFSNAEEFGQEQVEIHKSKFEMHKIGREFEIHGF